MNARYLKTMQHEARVIDIGGHKSVNPLKSFFMLTD